MIKKITSFFCILSVISLTIYVCFLKIPDFNVKAGNFSQNTGRAARVADEIIVKFKGSDSIDIIKIADTADFQNILDGYNRNPEILYAEPNYTYLMTLIPSDTYFKNQWYLEKIKAVETWDTVRENPNIVIAVMDSGIDLNHPDLRDNIWVNIQEIKDDKSDNDRNGFIDDVNGWDFVNNVADPSPKFKEGFTEAGVLHGTVVAGIAAASGNNATGISGIVWKAKIMPLKVLDDKGEGNTNNVIKAIDYAIANGANIINFSFVGFGFSYSLDDAIKRAYNAGIVVVAAAGNEDNNDKVSSLDDAPMYPVCYDGNFGENRVIGVAATDTLDQKAPFSSYGFSCVDISAPGVSIFSTVAYAPTVRIDGEPLDEYYNGYWSGTSMATPMVSAAFALVEKVNPSLDRKKIIDIILSSSDSINKLNPTYLNQLGRGRLNILAAVNSAKNTLQRNVTKLLIAPSSDYKSLIKISDESGTVTNKDFEAGYGDNYRGGISMASGDFTGDGSVNIVTAPTRGSAQIKIFNLENKLIGQFTAFSQASRGGTSLAIGDINGDRVDEIIVGAGSGMNPQIKVFNAKGKLLSQFFAYARSFRGGVNLAVGDTNGDGIDEIVTGAGANGGPQIRIFDMKGYVFGQFFAYSADFRGGVRVAVGDIDGGVSNKRVEIITAPGPGGEPVVKIFTNQGKLINKFPAYNNVFKGGVNLVAGDINNDGYDEIITGAGAGGSPHIRVFSKNGDIIGSFYAYDADFSGGVSVSTIKGDANMFVNMAQAGLATSTFITK